MSHVIPPIIEPRINCARALPNSSSAAATIHKEDSAPAHLVSS
jgi:hypothetical protein